MYSLLDQKTLTIEQVRERLRVFTHEPDFKFDPVPHEYRLRKRLLTSATSLVKKYHKPFIKEKQAPLTARKTGQTVAEVLAEWEYAGVMGSITHDYIEHEYPLWYNRQNDLINPYPEDQEATRRIRKFQLLREQRLLDMEPVGQEIRMFYTPPGWELDLEHPGGLSGTLDLLCWHHPTRRLYVGDYKTSKVIRRDEDEHWDMFYPPFQRLKVNQHNEYSLQICVYRLFLESIGIPTAGGFIMHLPPGTKPAEIIQAKDFRQDLRFLFSKN
jgi:hypothetical protein